MSDSIVTIIGDAARRRSPAGLERRIADLERRVQALERPPPPREQEQTRPTQTRGDQT